MTSPILRLTAPELRALLDAIDPLEVIVAEFTGTGAGAWARAGNRLTPWHGEAPPSDLVLLDDRSAGSRCILPSSILGALRTAAMVTIAARKLVARGVITAAVLGFGLVSQVCLPLIVRYLTGLSYVAICPIGGRPPCFVLRQVTDRLDRAGVAWSTPTAIGESVFGATLIVTTAATRDWPEIGRLPSGATLINTTGTDLPDTLVDAVDQVFVDDLALIEPHAHRYFARMHLTGSAETAGVPDPDTWRHRPVKAGFAQLLTGAQTGRSHADDVVLMELLGTDRLDVGLASTLHQAARIHGLGVEVVE